MFNLWSDEDRLFIPRLLGWSINFKYIARKLGWVKPLETPSPAPEAPQEDESSEERLRRAVDRSRYEEPR